MGLIILGLITLPLFALMLACVFDPPRPHRVAAMFTGVFLLQVVAMIAGFIVLALVLRFVVP